MRIEVRSLERAEKSDALSHGATAGPAATAGQLLRRWRRVARPFLTSRVGVGRVEEAGNGREGEPCRSSQFCLASPLRFALQDCCGPLPPPSTVSPRAAMPPRRSARGGASGGPKPPRSGPVPAPPAGSLLRPPPAELEAIERERVERQMKRRRQVDGLGYNLARPSRRSACCAPATNPTTAQCLLLRAHGTRRSLDSPASPHPDPSIHDRRSIIGQLRSLQIRADLLMNFYLLGGMERAVLWVAVLAVVAGCCRATALVWRAIVAGAWGGGEAR